MSKRIVGLVIFAVLMIPTALYAAPLDFLNDPNKKITEEDINALFWLGLLIEAARGEGGGKYLVGRSLNEVTEIVKARQKKDADTPKVGGTDAGGGFFYGPVTIQKGA